jgi:catechol 2,3-dioxygenase-like lactoylglutathione lyase family enzyme
MGVADGYGDQRPPLWVGHVVLFVPDVARAKSFFLSIGMRDAEPDAAVGVMELRGGTHLLLLPTEEPVKEGTRAPFDLMVEDHNRARDAFLRMGLTVSDIERNPSHEYFTVREPSGYDIVVNSSHVTGRPV